MVGDVKQGAFELRPAFESNPESLSLFFRCVAVLVRQLRGGKRPDELPAERHRLIQRIARRRPPNEPGVRLAVSVLCDLIAQGWTITFEGGRVWVAQPANLGTIEHERDRVRGTLLLARHEQLSSPQVQSFVKSMETRRLGPRGWCSVFDLIRDGKEMAEKLRDIQSLSEENRPSALATVIQPYLQFVQADDICEWTGLRLSDIWRYFRYTWLTPARSTPGRTMYVLVRDASMQPHPVVGIAALSSSIVQQTERDEWIGWTGDKALERLVGDPSTEHAKWLLDALEEAIRGIYVQDFLEDRTLSSEDLRMPTQVVIDNLQECETEYKEMHRTQARAAVAKKGNGLEDWDDQARTFLFKGKRAGTLASLLQIRQDFKECGFWFASGSALATALEKPQFRHSTRKLVRLIKASRVGISMMDISVAGAIAPYNELLGGKLVSMLLCSAEVREEYRNRYKNSPSIIASSMKGSAVFRDPQLVLLCTTGLFGNGSTQYNRIKVPSAGMEPVVFKKLDCVTQYGTFHFSDATIFEMKRYAETEFDGSDVRGIFGEGVNPRMRKIRQSLDRLGFPSDKLLRHSTPRSVYVISLASNFREVLLGIDKKPQYLRNGKPKEDTHEIVGIWRDRWLSGRACRADVIESVDRHRLDKASHSALVALPSIKDANGSLFEEGVVDYTYDWEG